uniref:Sucrose synthase n=1 Tax=Rhizophora mucronata TaxID=61149 RepID=A0A2P2MKR1_RHIMU
MADRKLTRIPSMRDRVEDTLSAHRNELVSLLSRFIYLPFSFSSISRFVFFSFRFFLCLPFFVFFQFHSVFVET